MEPVANSVGIITGAIHILNAIYRSVEAVNDAPTHIAHLQEFSKTVREELKSVERALQTFSEGPHPEDGHTFNVAPVAGLIQIMKRDLEHVYRTTTSHGIEKTSNGFWKRLKRPNLITALEIKLKLNNKAMDRIDRGIQTLTLTTTRLWTLEMKQNQPNEVLEELRSLQKHLADERPVRTITREPASKEDKEDLQTESQLQSHISTLKKCAFQHVKKITERNLELSSRASVTSSPPPTPPRPPTPPPSEPAGESKSIDDNVQPLEWKYRHDHALRLAEIAIEQGFADVAAIFHGQAMAIRKDKLDGPIDFKDRAELEIEHIRILLKCLELSQRHNGLTRLNTLAAMINDEAPSSPPSLLFKARVDVGHLFFDNQMYDRAIEHLRNALFSGDLLKKHEDNRAAIQDLVQTVYRAYGQVQDHVAREPFIKYIEQQINRNPLADAAMDEMLYQFLRQWDFDVGSQSSGNFGELRDSKGNSPLHVAVMPGKNRDARIVRRLATESSAINSVNNDGLTPLFCAVEAGNIEWVKILLEEGASLDIRKPPADLSMTILHCCRSPVIMDLLLNKIRNRISSTGPETPNTGEPAVDPVTIDTTARCSSTPLHVACERNDYETATVLIDHKADVLMRNSDGQTALIIACYGVAGSRANSQTKSQTKNLVRLLVNKGSDANAADEDGRTPTKGLEQRRFSTEEIKDMLSWGRAMSHDSGVGISP